MHRLAVSCGAPRQRIIQSKPNKHHQSTIQHVNFRDASKSWIATVKIKQRPKPKKRSFIGTAWHATVGGIEKGAKFAYKASGLSDVVGCITAPSLGGCAQAAVLVAAFAVTGGEDELEIAAYKAGEEIGADAAADVAADEGGSVVEEFKPDVNSDGSVPMPGTKGTRPLDGGSTAASVGNKIWGAKPEGVAEALGKTMRPEELRAQASLSDALRLRKFYANAAALRPQNPSAAGRVELLQRIIDAYGHNG